MIQNSPLLFLHNLCAFYHFNKPNIEVHENDEGGFVANTDFTAMMTNSHKYFSQNVRTKTFIIWGHDVSIKKCKQDIAIEILDFMLKNTTDSTLANHIEKYFKDYSRENSNSNQLSERMNICLKDYNHIKSFSIAMNNNFDYKKILEITLTDLQSMQEIIQNRIQILKTVYNVESNEQDS